MAVVMVFAITVDLRTQIGFFLPSVPNLLDAMVKEPRITIEPEKS